MYTWVIIPNFSNAKEFSLPIDEYVSWEVKILPLSGIDLNIYSTEGSGIPADFEFSGYRVGETSRATTVPVPPAKLLIAWPKSGAGLVIPIPANATLTFIFDATPKDVTVSHGRAITDGKVLTVSGPFPLGDIAVEIGWNQGRKSYTWYHVITEPDFEPPKVVQAWAFFNNGLGIGFEDGWGFSPDVEVIKIDFSEAVWFHEEVTGNMDIQTEDGTNLGWRGGRRVPFSIRTKSPFPFPTGNDLILKPPMLWRGKSQTLPTKQKSRLPLLRPTND